MPTARRRRATGLRREEVASRAGISAAWYTTLEPGRGASPSLTTLDGLARALRLDATDRAHLLALTGKGKLEAPRREDVPDTLRAIVEALEQPAYITGRRWEVLAWNQAAANLLVDFGILNGDDRNVLVWMLTDAGARHLFASEWEEEARRMLSLFRATFDLYPGDAMLARLVARFMNTCPPFADWWGRHDVGSPRSGAKLLHHPVQGKIRVLYSTFQANDDPALKLALYAMESRFKSN